jgi:cytochrome c556
MSRKPRLYIALHLGLTAALALVGGIAFAAGEIQNPDVKARVEVMLGLKAQAKVLSDVAAGTAPFEATQVAAAIAALRDGAGKVGPAFRPLADDPASVASPEIWASPAEFRQKTAKLGKVVGAIDGSGAGALADTLGPVTAACKDCHGRFKM